jgi:hypothetical protein
MCAHTPRPFVITHTTRTALLPAVTMIIVPYLINPQHKDRSLCWALVSGIWGVIAWW